MNEIIETSPEDFDDWINWDEVTKRWQQEIDDYRKWDEEYRQEYWIRTIFTSWRRGSDVWTPLKISEIRKNNIDMEPNLDRFLPLFIEFIEDEWFEIEDIIILDKQAKKYLEKIWYSESSKVKNDVKDLIK